MKSEKFVSFAEFEGEEELGESCISRILKKSLSFFLF